MTRTGGDTSHRPAPPPPPQVKPASTTRSGGWCTSAQPAAASFFYSIGPYTSLTYTAPPTSAFASSTALSIPIGFELPPTQHAGRSPCRVRDMDVWSTSIGHSNADRPLFTLPPSMLVLVIWSLYPSNWICSEWLTPMRRLDSMAKASFHSPTPSKIGPRPAADWLSARSTRTTI